MKTIIGMAKINWKYSGIAYRITGITFTVGLLQYILDLTVNPPGNISTAAGNYLFLLPLYMGIFVTALNFPKLMNLGGKRMDFFKSGIITYAIASVSVSLLSLISYFTIDKLVLTNDRIAAMLDLYDVFGFMDRGVLVALIQMSVFLFLLACTAHTITLVQGKWYGWAADVIIVAIISVFIPIAPLRAALVWFFNMIIFHEFAVVQILSCLVLSALIYSASIIPIKSRRI